MTRHNDPRKKLLMGISWMEGHSQYRVLGAPRFEKHLFRKPKQDIRPVVMASTSFFTSCALANLTERGNGAISHDILVYVLPYPISAFLGE
jgi:hypothetical protein